MDVRPVISADELPIPVFLPNPSKFTNYGTVLIFSEV